MYLRNNLLTTPVPDLDPLNEHPPRLPTDSSPVGTFDPRAATKALIKGTTTKFSCTRKSTLEVDVLHSFTLLCTSSIGQ
jgi:hypothetical protein